MTGKNVADADLTVSTTNFDSLITKVTAAQSAAIEVTLQDVVNTFMSTTGASYSILQKTLLQFQMDNEWGTLYIYIYIMK